VPTQPYNNNTNTTPALQNQPDPGIGPTNQPEPPQQEQPQQQPQQQQQQPSPVNVGHDGTINGQTREQWRDAWMGSGMQTQQSTDSWMSQNGATKLANNGTFMTPFGEVLDLGINYRTNNVTPGWTQVGGGGGVPQNYSDTGVGPSNYPGQSGMQGNPFAGMDPAMMSAFQQFLLNYNKPQEPEPIAHPAATARYDRRSALTPSSATQARQGRRFT
jgi:hypothetical protein